MTSRDALREKALAFRHGLDDRAIEMLKFGIRGQAKMDGLAPVDSDCEVWLESLEDGSMVFSLRVDGRWLQSLLSMGAYDLYEKALGRSSVADDHSYFVDGAWAERALDAVYGEGLL